MLHACVSGLAPYEHLGERRVGAALLPLKAREHAGELLPVSYDALAAAPGVPGWVARELFWLLRDCVGREPMRRPTAQDARRRLEELLARAAPPRARRDLTPSPF